MSLTEQDLWDPEKHGADPLAEDDEAQPEPVADQPVAEEPVTETPAPTEEPEGEPVESTDEGQPADAPSTDGSEGGESGDEAEPADDEADQPLPPNEDYKHRYEQLRNSRENTRAELERERARSAQIEAAARELLQSEQARLEAERQARQPAELPPIAEPSAAELERRGIDRDQYMFLAQQFREAAQQGIAPQVQQLQQQTQQLGQQLTAQQQAQLAAQQQAQAAEEKRATAAALKTFEQAHTEFQTDTPESRALVGDIRVVLETWDSAWGDAYGSPDISDVPTLEVAYEAAKWPAFADVLALNPTLFDSERGLQLARVQARMLDAERGTAPAKSPKVNPKAVDAALSAAHTEPGRSGPAESAGARDQMDDALDEWQADQNRSVF